MGVSLADLDRWDPGAIRAVGTAATNCANHFRDVAHNQSAIVTKLVWEGASRDAAMARAQSISNSLLHHADECDRAARFVSSAASEVESIKAEWTRIQRMADRWGITIDVVTGSLECFDSTMLATCSSSTFLAGSNSKRWISSSRRMIASPRRLPM